MAKKKEETSEQQTPPPTPPQIEEHNLERGAEVYGYTVGSWAGHEQYQCNHCEFDSLELGVMEEHVMLAHGIFRLKEPVPAPTPDLTPSPSPEGRGESNEKADGLFEIDLKEDQ